MMGAFWILLVTVVTGVILYIHHRLTDKEEAESVSASQEQVVDRPEGCCGQHAVCEKESLLTGIDNKIIYYEIGIRADILPRIGRGEGNDLAA